MTADLLARIRAVHAALVSEGHHDLRWVSLARLRPLLADVPAGVLDDALWAMRRNDRDEFLDVIRPHRAPTTAEELAAAVRRGNLDYPFLAIR